jgi:RNA recognition motif-containing protein
MATNLYVGNLPFTAKDSDLEQLFAEHGSVVSAKVVIDRETNRSRGFGFVEMATEEEAQAAIDSLDQKEFMGRTLKVNMARPREQQQRRPGGGGGGQRYGGGGGGGGGYNRGR